MERIGDGKIYSFISGSVGISAVSNSVIRKDDGYFVENYLGLAAKIAELQYRNRNYVLFFRGQNTDWKSYSDRTTIKPTIFRLPKALKKLPESVLKKRYEKLLKAESLIVDGIDTYTKLGKTRIIRNRLLRWSIIQHYEICDTPLIDVTQSIRIAASFATLGATDNAFVYVIAVPNISGAITASIEGGLQVLRLSSFCPPAAIRPHIQEGYLLGEYPEMANFEQLQHYEPHEVDFARRIVGKFRFNPKTFWNDATFPQVVEGALYPRGRDWLENLTAQVKQKL